MSDGDWIKQRIAEAKIASPLVSQPVLTRLEELLKGRLGERELPKKELAQIARKLLVGLVSGSMESKTGR